MGLSINDMFEMDLWQFVCYMDGYEAKCRKQDLSYLMLALNISAYSAGNAFSKQKKPDAQKQYNDISEDINGILLGKQEDKVAEEKKAQDELDLVKKQLTRYKWKDI